MILNKINKTYAIWLTFQQGSDSIVLLLKMKEVLYVNFSDCRRPVG